MISYLPSGQVRVTDDANPDREPLIIAAGSTPSEIEAAILIYLGAPAPDSDWLGFAGWLFRFPPMAEAMNTARVSTSDQGEPATTALPAAMQEARLNQNYPAWAATWGQFLLASQMPPEALTEIIGKAMACHLPPEFIAALQPQLPGGEG
jgi:hypothetical protein